MGKISQLFNNNTMENDVRVSQFVKKHFKVLPNQLFVGLNQCCKGIMF